MKKKTLLLAGLVLIPLAMGLLSAMPSILVMDGDKSWHTTFMELIPDCDVGWFPYVAAVLNYSALGLAAVFVVLKKEWCLQYVMWMSVGACVLISATLVIRGEIRVIPNLLTLLLTAAEGALGYYIHKNPELVGGLDDDKDFRLTRR